MQNNICLVWIQQDTSLVVVNTKVISKMCMLNKKVTPLTDKL